MLEIAFEPAVWANFEIFLTHPSDSASVRGASNSEAGGLRRKRRGAYCSQGLRICSLSPFLVLKGYWEQEAVLSVTV